MSSKTTLEALAEHYDGTDTAAELRAATAADGPEAPLRRPRSPTG